MKNIMFLTLVVTLVSIQISVQQPDDRMQDFLEISHMSDSHSPLDPKTVDITVGFICTFLRFSLNFAEILSAPQLPGQSGTSRTPKAGEGAKD
jgi:hypothetical protein